MVNAVLLLQTKLHLWQLSFPPLTFLNHFGVALHFLFDLSKRMQHALINLSVLVRLSHARVLLSSFKMFWRFSCGRSKHVVSVLI